MLASWRGHWWASKHRSMQLLAENGDSAALVRRAIAACALALSSTVVDAAYPERPIRLVVPYVPGGNIDLNARAVAPGLGEFLGQPVVVDNRGGAGGRIGTEFVARAAPDGYTLLLGSGSPLTMTPIFYKASYDALRDFATTSMISVVPLVLTVHPSVPARSVRELVALSKSRPGRLSMGSAGTGGAGHLTGEFFQLHTGAKFIHVPYKGSGPALVDLIGGQLDLMFDQLTTSSPLIESGRLRALAVSSLKRSTLMPAIPTMNESGAQGFEVVTYTGILLPAATPKDVVSRVHAALVRTLELPAMKETFAKLGAELMPSTAETFTNRLRNDLVNWRKVRDQLKLQLE